VRIKGNCKRDGREFLAEQAVASGGRCPWDGEPFNADYAVTLVNALRDAQEAGEKLEQALTQIADLRPDFTLEAGSIVAPLQVQLARITQNLISQG
jgi:hypothetical protein